MNEFRLSDLINLDEAQVLQDSFSRLSGMAAVLCDLEEVVTQLSVPTEFSGKLVDDPKLGFSLLDFGTADFTNAEKDIITSDIYAGGRKVGTIRAKRLLTKKPDDAEIAKIAEELVVNPSVCAAELADIRVISAVEIEAAQKLIDSLSELLSIKADERLSSLESSEKAASGTATADQLYAKVQEVRRLVRETNKNNERLEENFKRLSASVNRSAKSVSETEDTVKKIQDIAMNTRILGFNASIEASRAKESGRGFGVIAQEVRNLAEVSKSSADKIEDIVRTIGDNTEEINDNMKRIGEIVKQNLHTAGEMSDYLAEVSEISSCVK